MLARSYRLFTVHGVVIRAHVSWLPLWPLLIWTLASAAFPALVPELPDPSYAIMAAFGGVGLVLLLLLREWVRIIVARRIGAPMREITLYVFGGVPDGQHMSVPVKAEVLMALSSVSASLLSGLLLFVLLFRLADANTELAWSGLIFLLGLAALGLAALHLIPAYPFDGGRLASRLLNSLLGDLSHAIRAAAGVGTAVGLAAAAAGVFALTHQNYLPGLWLIVTGALLVDAARLSWVRAGALKSA